MGWRRTAGGLAGRGLNNSGYWQYAENYYRKNGEPTKQLHRIRMALRPVKALYGHTSGTNAGGPTTFPPSGTPRSLWAYAAEPV